MIGGLENLIESGKNLISKTSDKARYFLFGSILFGFLGLLYDTVKAQSISSATISGNVKEVVSNTALSNILVGLKDLDGNIICLDTTDANGNYSLDCAVGVEENKPDNGKNKNMLISYPNPFSTRTNIRLSLSEESNVNLSVYDLLGREVENLVDGNLKNGIYNVEFTNKDLSSGVYFIRLKSNNYEETRKIVLIKGANSFSGFTSSNIQESDNTNLTLSLANYDFFVTDSLRNWYNYIERIDISNGNNLTKNVEMIATDWDSVNNVTFLQVFKALTATVDTSFSQIANTYWRDVDIPIPVNLDSVNAPDSFAVGVDSGLTSWENLSGRNWFNVIYCCSLPDSFGIDVKYDSLTPPIGGLWGVDKAGWEGSCGYIIHGYITIDTININTIGVQMITAHESGHGFGFYHPNEWVSGDNDFAWYTMRTSGSNSIYPHPFEGKALQILYGFDNRCTNMGPYRDDWVAWITLIKKEEDYWTTTDMNGDNCKFKFESN